MYAKYIAPLPSQEFCVGTYGGLNSIVSTSCTGIGIFKGTDGGRVCAGCEKLRKARGTANPGTTLNKWYPSLSRSNERRHKEVMTKTDLEDARQFSKNKNVLLTPDGKLLKDEAIAQCAYGDYMAELDKGLTKKTYKKIGDDSMPGMEALFNNATQLCKDNPTFQSSIAIAVLKSAVARELGSPNAKLDEAALNLVRIIRTYDKKAAMLLSANLYGPSDRWLRRLDAKDRDGCILDADDAGAKTGARIEAGVERRSNNNGSSLAFSMAIDATKVPEVLELSSGYKALVGAAHPKQLIDISGKSKDNVRLILDGKDPEHGTIPLASEIKIAVVTYQGGPVGINPSEIVAARPQTNNESNDFIMEMERAASAISKSTGASFTNITVDGVSCESRHVWRMICEFLSLLANHVGSTDTNHNCKSWRYQIIAGGGSECCTIGKFMIDADLLRLGGVSRDLWRPNDFAADLPVLELVSLSTITKIASASPEFGSTIDGDKSVLALTLFFMKLRLHAVNGKSVPARHRAVYLWCSMIWLTSICGASAITKRNIVNETIAFIFLVLRSDVPNPRYCTSEPAEHTFGLLRTMIREFTTLEFAQLVEKLTRRLRLMYKNNVRPSHERQKGYMSTFDNFFEYSMDQNLPYMEGAVDIDKEGDFVAKQLWPVVCELISFSHGMMTQLLTTLGVAANERSPFCRDFSSLIDLRDEFIKFCPQTFEYDGVKGTGSVWASAAKSGDNDTGAESGNTEGPNRSNDAIMLDRLEHFTSEFNRIAKEADADDDVDEVIVVDSDTVNEGVREDEPVEVAASKPSAAIDNNELMTHFQSLVQVDNADDLLAKVLVASSSIEGKSAAGSVSFLRKAKSLVQRWLAKLESGGNEDSDSTTTDTRIERDVILMVNAKMGSGASAVNVASYYRVVNVFEKYYNKWFMSMVPFKLWKKEPKSYKIKIRMLRKNVLGEFCDVDLCGDATVNKENICRIIEDKMIIGVVGKLKEGVCV